MNNFNDVYLNIFNNNQLIYEWNEQLLKDQHNQIQNQYNNNLIEDWKTYINTLIFESTYFSNINNIFENWFVQLFDQLYEEMKYAKANNQILSFSKQIKISEIAKNLPLSKIKDYKNFHNFVNVLKQSIGYIEIKFDIFNYYQPPIEWLEEKIYIKDLPSISERLTLGSELDKAGNYYKEYMLKISERANTLKEKYSIIKNNILSQTDFGIIGINGKYLTTLSEFKNSTIIHEFEHLLDYLIKINAENWEIGRQYRSTLIHNDFVLNRNGAFNEDEEIINYYLDEKEFKPLYETFIEQLKILFKKYYNLNDKNNIYRFFNHLMEFCKIPFRFSIKKDTQEIENKYYLQNMQIFSKYHLSNQLQMFFNIIWKESIKNDNNNRNRWTILKKWLIHEFFKH